MLARMIVYQQTKNLLVHKLVMLPFKTAPDCFALVTEEQDTAVVGMQAAATASASLAMVVLPDGCARQRSSGNSPTGGVGGCLQQPWSRCALQS